MPRAKQITLGKVLVLLGQQSLNSFIVALYATLGLLVTKAEFSWKLTLATFGITFLTELRRYRKI